MQVNKQASNVSVYLENSFLPWLSPCTKLQLWVYWWRGKRDDVDISPQYLSKWICSIKLDQSENNLTWWDVSVAVLADIVRQLWHVHRHTGLLAVQLLHTPTTQFIKKSICQSISIHPSINWSYFTATTTMIISHYYFNFFCLAGLVFDSHSR